MPDIRTTGPLDDFNRSNENPLSGGGNWAQAITTSTAMQLLTNAARGQSSTVSSSYWTLASFDDDCEVWGKGTGTLAIGDSHRLALWADTGTANVDGYQFVIANQTGTDFWRLRRVTNSATAQEWLSSGTDLSGVGADMFMLRINGDDIEGWHSADNGSNWTLQISTTDTTYRSDFYLVLGAENSSSPSMGWDYFGGGKQVPTTQQIIRRIHT